MEMINMMVNKISAWIDSLFQFFGFYSERYSGLIVYGFLALILAKIFKIKLNYTKGGSKS